MSRSESYDDLTLLQLLKQGSKEAFSEVYYLLSPAIFRRILWMVNDTETSKELLQDLFLKLWENREKIDPDKSLNAYLNTIAVNLVYDYFRKVSKKRAYERHILSLALDSYSHIEEKIISKENISLLYEMMDHLPEQRKKVYMLCKIEGKSYDEVSALMHISKSTIQDHIVKANHTIRDFIGKHPGLLQALVIISLLS